MYTSPKFYDVTVTAANHAQKTTNKETASSVSVAYTGYKGLYVALASETNTVANNVSAGRLVVKYKIKSYTVGALYQTSSKQDAATEELRKAKAATMLNGSYNHKNLTYKLQYTTSEQQIQQTDLLGSAIASTGTTANDKSSTVTTLGVDYALSKKSTAVAYYSAQDFTAESGQTKTKSNTVFGVGLVHNF